MENLIRSTKIMLHFVPVDCHDPKCSGHGIRVSVSCICEKGWKGEFCDLVDAEGRKCLPSCSGRGDFDVNLNRCICHHGFMGEECEIGRNFTP